ncbi:MAG: hypothetical protein H6837_19000 [Planctomycetes bacterium]|nr:hypothetical protein [Planctomycetota bacterium]
MTLLALLAAACRAEPGTDPGHDPPNTTQTADTEFLRFTDLGAGRGLLETAVVRYVGRSGAFIDLIGAVHIADRDYYRRLQARFGSYDALLYELVKPAGTPPPSAGADRAPRAGGVVSAFQRMLRNVLGLEFQLDAVDYRAPNFVHADLDTATFTRMSKDKGETLLGLMFELAKRQLAGSQRTDPGLGLGLLAALFAPDREKRLKYLLARELPKLEGLLAGLGPREGDGGSVLLIGRNRRLMEVLRARVRRGDRRIGVFFGAAHLPDVEQRIFSEIGFRRTSITWEKAWTIE